MINRQQLLKDLQRELPKIEKDILAYSESNPELTQHLQDEYKKAQEAGRTADHFVAWREAQITQAAVAWVLTCVFVRFMEDNGLLVEPVLSGPAERENGDKPLHHAKERMVAYFNDNPTHAEREYLLSLFEELEKFPVIAELLDHKHNPLWQIPVSADGAKLLIDFFQKIDVDTGDIVHDFTDENWDTRFLGDLYQDLSESVRKKYALLQTPEFVESFILDYTLEKAKETFGLEGLRLIDPTCGSGHFLLTTFERCFDDWVRREPTTNTRELAQRALDVVHGVDVNPYAIAICRFRLLVAAMKACGSRKVKDAPNFKFNLACGDSLLHGRRFEWQGQGIQNALIGEDPIKHVLEVEDKDTLDRILGQQYHAVVGNPPYITVKDKSLNESYRSRYLSCSGKYSLGVPFTERFYELAVKAETSDISSGYVGMITTNSFMKRRFGKTLIEDFLVNKDISHIIDTSGAYIPGHGTPTVILFGRNRQASIGSVRAVLGINAEPSDPIDPSKGLVWSSIHNNIDSPGFENEYVSILDQDKSHYDRHPWSLVGGGATELKTIIDLSGVQSLNDISTEVGVGVVTGDDEIFTFKNQDVLSVRGIKDEEIRNFVEGEKNRDWKILSDTVSIFPYDENFEPKLSEQAERYLWPVKVILKNRVWFRKTQIQRGLNWYEYSHISKDKFKESAAISFPEIASHNHFYFTEKECVYNQTIPVIKLKNNEDYLNYLAYFNSSAICFWIKQVSQQKQMTGGDGVRVGEKSKVPYQLSSTALKSMPVPFEDGDFRLTRLGILAEKISANLSIDDFCIEELLDSDTLLENAWNDYLKTASKARAFSILLQEEIDWYVYSVMGICDGKLLLDDLDFDELELEIGQRPFEIYHGKNIDGYDCYSSIPDHLPKALKGVWKSRLDEIQSNKSVRTLENPNYKRRWIGQQGLFNSSSKQNKKKEYCKKYLLTCLNSVFSTIGAELITVSQLIDRLSSNQAFTKVCSFMCDSGDVDVYNVVKELIEGSSVPLVSAIRLKPKAYKKYHAWQEAWIQERGGNKAVIPPRYASSDFRKPIYWTLRGKYDLPTENFFSMPYCERESDSTLVIGWVGMNDLQRAQAIAAWYLDRKETDGWEAEKLMPMLVALDELIPWLKQWHNEIDPEFGERMGDYYEGFLLEEMRQLSVTKDDLLAWEPPAATRTRRRA